MNGAQNQVVKAPAELVASLADLEAGRQAFADLLGWGNEAVAPLEDFLRRPAESIPEPRCLAAQILAAIGTPLAIAALRRAFEDCASREGLDPVLAHAERSVASAIADHLGALGDRESADLLFAALRRHPWSGCARALGRLRDDRAIPVLADRLDDDAARPAVTEALRSFGYHAVLDLRRVLGRSWDASSVEPGWRIAARAAAANLLGEMGTVDARLSLICSLFDPAPAVRLAAATALARFGPEEAGVALPCLIDLLGSESWLDADVAADALVSLGEMAILPLSAAVARAATDIVHCRRVIAVLGRLGTEGAGGALAVAARSNAAVVRLAAAAALANVPGPGAISALRSLVEDQSAEVRVRAVDALGRRGQGGLRAIAPSLGDPDGQVRQAARQILERAAEDAAAVLRDLRDGQILCRGDWTGTRRARHAAATLLGALQKTGPGGASVSRGADEGEE